MHLQLSSFIARCTNQLKKSLTNYFEQCASIIGLLSSGRKTRIKVEENEPDATTVKPWRAVKWVIYLLAASPVPSPWTWWGRDNPTGTPARSSPQRGSCRCRRRGNAACSPAWRWRSLSRTSCAGPPLAAGWASQSHRLHCPGTAATGRSSRTCCRCTSLSRRWRQSCTHVPAAGHGHYIPTLTQHAL